MDWTDWHAYLALGFAVLGVVVLVGYGRSLAGVTRAQRSVRVRGRIEEVRAPRNGGSGRGGISVVVSYREPSTGEEVVVTNDGERGETITAAWTGREIGVHYPRGRPHAYRFSDDPEAAGGRGLGWPNTALFLIYVGLVVVASIDWDWPWALIGVCGPWALIGVCYLPGHVRDVRRRRERLAAMADVPGRIVAVLTDVSSDAEGGVSRTVTPVVAFTTREGVDVTAHCGSGVADPAGAYGREVTVHYPQDDPAGFVLDHAARQRSARSDIAVTVVTLVVVTAAAVVGVVLL
ncbi:hypothetical protein GCM10018790_77400 [Kitasatospora xanthocidica]|uniref:DUF3592 domain-containing protein n=1 Tax=Kitasatospora xanthocidica TaxID=83382 RepID=UPI00167AAB99|nr:DUF3592 domain-containing protein [Kitasatospora xanthocidica]GHF88493.1 hypothetical protein GCM10018790_77400 [Kitasatospora xanthocidica]